VVVTPSVETGFLSQGFPGQVFSASQTFDVVLLAPQTLVNGSVTAGDCKPLAGQAVVSGGSSSYADQDGRFRLMIAPGSHDFTLASPAGGVQVQTGLLAADGSAISSVLEYSMSGAATIAGTATLSAAVPTRVISGVVLGPDGQPLAGATVAVEQSMTPDPDGKPIPGYSFGASWSVPSVEAGNGTMTWQPTLTSASTTTDAAGNFKLTVLKGSGTIEVTPPRSIGRRIPVASASPARRRMETVDSV
jgi:hypothetical protein